MTWNTCSRLAIVLRVTEAFMHCAKAFPRSHLWDPEHHQDRADMPSPVKIILEQTTGAPDDAEKMRKLDHSLEEDCRKLLCRAQTTCRIRLLA